jgi:hypothetical protein
MNRSHHIFDFIDGALDSAKEQELFEDLARHPEMRAELRQYIAIGEAVRADREAYAPPSDVEHSLMSGLGLAPLVSVGGAGAGATGMLARLGIIKSFAPMVASFVAGALLAGGSVFYAFQHIESAGERSAMRDTVYLPNSTTGQVSPAPPAAAPTVVEQASPAVTDAAPRGLSSASLPRAWRSRPEPVRAGAIDAPIVVEPHVAMSSEPQEPMRAIAAAEPRAIASRSSAMLAAGTDTSDDALAIRGPQVEPSPIESLLGSRVSQGYFEVHRSVPIRPYVENNARKVDPSPLDESSFSFYVPASESLWLGLEVGQGRYTQVLVLPEDYVDAESGRHVGQDFSRVEQNPNILWTGLGARWQPGELASGVSWWMQGTLAYGLKNGGPLFNTRLGLSTKFGERLSLNGSLETSTLVYLFNGQPLVSGKWGLGAGLQFDL